MDSVPVHTYGGEKWLKSQEQEGQGGTAGRAITIPLKNEGFQTAFWEGNHFVKGNEGRKP